MPVGLPDAFLSTNALPFNRESLDKDFRLSTPDRDPGGGGVWLLFNGQQILTLTGHAGPNLPSGDLAPVEKKSSPLFIGYWQGRPCRMLSISEKVQIPHHLEMHSLHARTPQIPISIYSLAGLGLMIQHWENSSRFCGYCGNSLIRLANEWGKECVDCNNHHFPRIHPCVIGLIIKGNKLLLVRKPEWADGRFGLVAGFIEFGESMEEALVREVAEETSIQIKNIRYLGSQSWPFPSQIMNGFVADFAAGEIKLQLDELEEAAWFSLDQLPTLPPRRSIARYLIDQAGRYITT